MKSLFTVINDVIDPNLCDHVLNKYKDSPLLQNASVGLNEQEKSDVRRSSICWVDDSDILSTTNNIGHQVNSLEFGFDLYSVYSNKVQFTKYDSSYLGKYDWHMDSKYSNSENLISQRKMSFIIQLSSREEYDGGEILFKIDSKEYSNADFYKKGAIIAFPSFVLHKVNEVTNGTRHSLVCWMQGPNFR